MLKRANIKIYNIMDFNKIKQLSKLRELNERFYLWLKKKKKYFFLSIGKDLNLRKGK